MISADSWNWRLALRRMARVLGYLLGALLIGFIILLVIFAIDANFLKKPLLGAASAMTGREIRMNGDLVIQPFSAAPFVRLHELVIGNPDWAESREMAQIDEVNFNFNWHDLLRGEIVIPQLTIANPNLAFMRRADGQANWIFSDNPDDANDEGIKLPVIKQLILVGGKLSVDDKLRKVKFEGTVQSGAGENNQFVLDGEGKLNGKNFAFDMSGPPLLDIKANEPYAFNLDIKLAETTANAKGTITEPFDMGGFDAALDVKGNDLADLYLITGLAFPNTPPYHLSGQLSRKEDEFHFREFGGNIGGSDIFGDLKVHVGGKRPKIIADIKSRKLDFVDLGALFGARVDGADVPSEAPAAGPVLFLPDAPLQVERVRAMDAEVHYRAESVQAHDLPLKEVALDFTLQDAVLKFNPFSFTLPQGKISGTATVDANPDVPVVDMDVRLTGAKLQDFFKGKDGSPPPLEGTVIARAKLQGYGNSVHKAAASSTGNVSMVMQGSIRRAFAELMGINVVEGLGLMLSDDQEQTELRCGVASFRVNKGMMASRVIVFDTGVVLSRGEGGINLQTEEIDIKLQGEPKEARLLRVMAPITIGGTLRNPSVGVDAAAAVGQVGIAAALGAVLTPLASVLPFLSPDLAEDANCGRLIGIAKEKGGVTNTPALVPEAAKEEKGAAPDAGKVEQTEKK